MYTPRFSVPEKNNKYYNTIAAGGYSTCILGNYPYGAPSSSRTGYPGLNVLPNCVGYAMGRFNEIGDYKTFKYVFTGNAEDWYASAKRQGLSVGKEPKLGAVMCWAVGATGNGSDGAGHVAIIEQINSDGSVITSESGWSSRTIFWTKVRIRGTGNWGQNSNYRFLGFIYNPAVEKSYVIMKRGSTGPAVKDLQRRLNTFGWYDLNIDGSYGPATENAVKDVQSKLGLTVDGSAGIITQTYLDEQIILPSGAKWLTITADNKDRQMMGVVINEQNYVRLVDIYYQLNLAKVGYNNTTKKPFINTK